jgi:hypothetical protein
LKITTYEDQTTISAQGSEGFSTQNSGKIIKMLISGMYSDKEKSINRELWSNAFDAHAMVGKSDVPFVVNLPNHFVPEFSIQDFGPGISHEQMLNGYTVLGHSTKEDTNTAVGKWGVGRMSPMSYTDTFTVKSIHAGMVATYNVTMEGNGHINLNVLLPPVPTTEDSGLRISFPVKSKDFETFKAAANKVSLGFDVKPDTNGHTWPVLDVVSSGKGYNTFKQNYGYRGVVARMGCVLYPVNVSALTDLTHQDRAIISGLDIILDVPIGSVEVTASREDLSYGEGEPTKDFLTKKIKGIINNLIVDLQSSVDKCDSVYDAWVMLRGLSLPTAIKTAVKYNDEGINGSLQIDCGVDTYKRGWNDRVTREYRSFLNTEIKTVYVSYKNGPKHDIRADSRVRIEANKNETIGLVEAIWDKDDKSYDETDVQRLREIFGKARMANVSELSDPGAVKRTGYKAKVNDVRFNPIDVDMEDGGYYVDTYGGNVQWPPGVYDFSPRLLERVLQHHEPNKTIVLVPATLKKKFENHKDWVNVRDKCFDYIKADANKICDASVASDFPDEFGLEKFSDNFSGQLKQYYDMINFKFPKYGSFSTYDCILMLGAIRSTNTKQNPKAPTREALSLLKADILKKYPLLKYLKGNFVDKENLLHYVLAMDEFRSKS